VNRFIRDPWDIFVMMKKKKTQIDSEEKIISSVKREMERPRLTESVRNGGKDEAAPALVADPRAHSEKM
jgi:hypothetical protein